MTRPLARPATEDLMHVGNRDSRRIVPLPTSVAAFVGYFGAGPENDPIRVRSYQDVERRFGGGIEPTESLLALRQFFLNGGRSAFVVRTRRGVGRLVGTVSGRTGLYALLDLDPFAFDLLCIPDSSHLESEERRRVYAAAAQLCERQRAFFVCDPPASTRSISEILAWANGPENPRTCNGAVYFPRLVLEDGIPMGSPRVVSASGSIAGTIARSDAERGVWKSPAGIESRILGAVPEMEMTDAHNRVLNPRGVNVIRKLPDSGVIVWGARTLGGGNGAQEAFKYVSARRLALHLEQSIMRGLSWVVLERNEPALWAEVDATVTAFLHDVFSAGALRGTSPESAYYVRCDESTMTQADLDTGLVRVEAGIAALKPGDFVVLRFELRTQ